MNPNYPNQQYYPQSSGAAQMTNNQPAASAAPVPGPSRGASQQYAQWNELSEATGLSPKVIDRMIHLRATQNPKQRKGQLMEFPMVCEILRNEFGSEMTLDAEGLRYTWVSNIRPKLPKDFRVKHKLPAGTATGPAQGSGASGTGQPGPVNPQASRRDAPNPHGSFQNVHALSFGAPQPAPGGSFGGSQAGYGAQYPGLQPGSRGGPSGIPQLRHDDQYRAPHSSSGGPYMNTSVTNQQRPPVTFSNPPPDNLRLPPISSMVQLPGGRGAPPLEPQYPMSDQNYNNSASQETAPGMQEPVNFYRTGRGGPDSQATHGGSRQTPFDRQYEFSREEKEWLLREGMYLAHGHAATQEFYEKFEREFSGHKIPSKIRVMEEFKRMRK